jgi:hypothetical protein
MSLSLKVYNVPRGMEQDLVRLLLNKHFPLTKYAVNNSDPYDTMIDFSNPATGPPMRDFIHSVDRLRGQPVNLNAQLVSNSDLFFLFEKILYTFTHCGNLEIYIESLI